MGDAAIIIFWSLAYACMVIYSFIYRKEKKPFMPLIAGALNFGWKIHALITSGGNWGHIAWLTLDCFILVYNLYILGDFKKRLSYAAAVAACIIGLYGAFSITSFDGMLISSFVIDIIMAVEYVCTIKHISPRGRTIIGVFRLIGDLFAWLVNKGFSVIVFVIGAIVLLINLLYVAYCFELEKNNSRTHRNQKREKHKKK